MLFGVPAYWSGVSGAAKNFTDVLAGPAYDLDDPRQNVFYGKQAGVLVVGADAASAALGGAQMEGVLEHLGMWQVGPTIVLSNPRDDDFVPQTALARIVGLLGSLTLACCGRPRDEGLSTR